MSSTVLKTIENFNSQPHKEADFSISIHSFTLEYFNSQPHKEADERINTY